MIVVDTNVVSEWMRTPMDFAVGGWLKQQTAANLFLTATSLAELRFGVAIVPSGRRKSYLAATLEDIVSAFFVGRVLAFDAIAAEAYATIVSRARLRGGPIDIADGQIAAVAAVHGFAVATRDTSPFEAAGVAVINPWKT